MQIIENLREDLRNQADEATKESALRFFKEEVQFYGVKNAVVHKISKNYTRQIKEMSKSEVFNLCEILWQSGIMEESLVACNWSYAMRKHFDAGDIQIFERWIDSYVTNWASCDTFCNHTVGELVEKFPELVQPMDAPRSRCFAHCSGQKRPVHGRHFRHRIHPIARHRRHGAKGLWVDAESHLSASRKGSF